MSFRRQTTGSVVCPNCGRLVGVMDGKCFNCGRPAPGLFGWGPAVRKLTGQMSFGDVVTWGCVIMLGITLLWDIEGIRNQGFLGILAPSLESSFLFGASGAAPLFDFGRIWTVLSASWLHAGVVHIGFNLYYLRFLLPAVEENFGVGRTIVIYTVSSITGFGFTSVIFYLYHLGYWPGIPGLTGSAFSLGASASLCGLLGALWLSANVTGRSGMKRYMTQAALFILVIGFFVPNIDNMAHVGGFFGGVIAAKLLRPMQDESIYDLLAGLVCLLAMLASLVLSFVIGLGQLPMLRAMLGS